MRHTPSRPRPGDFNLCSSVFIRGSKCLLYPDPRTHANRDQDTGFHQHVEGNACHIQLGIDEIAPPPIQHHGKVEIAILPVIATSTRSKHDRLSNAVCAAQLSEESQNDAVRGCLFALLRVIRSRSAVYHAGGLKT